MLEAAASGQDARGGDVPAVVVTQDADEEPLSSSLVPYHAILATGYRLESRAFMTTYNSWHFSLATWLRFRDFCKDKAKQLGAAAWAACLEESVHAVRKRYHLHAY